jgi:hypothetical protein
MLSYGEKLLRAYVKRCFPDEEALYNHRDERILNDKTGHPLEIDIFLPNVNIGFEFQGRQHRTEQEQKERDKIKKAKCKELGITLIEVWTNTLTTDLYEFFRKKIDDSIDIKKPTKKFRDSFSEKTEVYKEMIYKMNRSINSDSFVYRRKKWKKNS